MLVSDPPGVRNESGEVRIGGWLGVASCLGAPVAGVAAVDKGVSTVDEAVVGVPRAVRIGDFTEGARNALVATVCFEGCEGKTGKLVPEGVDVEDAAGHFTSASSGGGADAVVISNSGDTS